MRDWKHQPPKHCSHLVWLKLPFIIQRIPAYLDWICNSRNQSLWPTAALRSGAACALARLTRHEERPSWLLGQASVHFGKQLGSRKHPKDAYISLLRPPTDRIPRAECCRQWECFLYSPGGQSLSSRGQRGSASGFQRSMRARPGLPATPCLHRASLCSLYALAAQANNGSPPPSGSPILGSHLHP